MSHRYEFARGSFEIGRADTPFLRAERRAEGTCSFRMIEGERLDTSHGRDLYRRIFAARTSATADPADQSGLGPAASGSS